MGGMWILGLKTVSAALGGLVAFGVALAGDAAADKSAYSRYVTGLSGDMREAADVGRAAFETSWRATGAHAAPFDGLGPTYNARACIACHEANGRGHPPRRPGERLKSLLIRLSVPGATGTGSPLPPAPYGEQLNDLAIAGVPAEGRAFLDYRPVPGRFGDGTPYTLRRPSYAFFRLAYGQLPENIMISPRVAPALAGLGLLEAVPDAAILARADPEDGDGDGISGRPNWVWDAGAGARRLGRFGWKANQPSLLQQTAAALLADMGITTTYYPEQNCPKAQVFCLSAGDDRKPEATDEILEALVAHGRALAPPRARWRGDPLAERGRELFVSARCGACHTPRLGTEADAPPPFANRALEPYTDLLLHDMGEGLADDRADFEATGREWRTPPLWGLGYLMEVNGHELLLHDGRARGFEEAILWHGGEAEHAKEAFRRMTVPERDALIAFLKAL